MKNIIFLLFIIFSISSIVNAKESSFINLALKQGLDKDDYWLKLLHFSNKKSTIKDKDFFISSSGYLNPKLELIETIKKFISDKNYICKYPARYRWLDSKINLNFKYKECKELKEFLKPNFEKISVVFTSQRYDSPASIFGHTMLKLDSKEIPYAINYSAKIPENTNSISYIYKGLNGKYKSSFKFSTFSIKDYEYRLGEFRDLIEFELKLNKSEIKNILYHFYEIRDSVEDYYFLSHNCSSEVLKILDMAKYNSNLSKELKNIVIPIDILYILQKHNYINSIYNKESKLKLFYKILNSLTKKQKDILYKIVHHNYSVNKFQKENIFSKDEKYSVILASIYYFEIKSMKGILDNKSIYPLIKLIDLELKYKRKDIFKTRTKLDKNPISNKFNKIFFGTDYFNHTNEIIFGYRYLYRNRFDLVDGIKKNGSVELLDIAIGKQNDKFSLKYLTLLNLEAMPISNLFFKESINKIKIGLKRIFNDKLYTYFNYGLGYRYRFNKNIDYQFYAKSGVYYNHKDIYLASCESSLEYNYKNRYILELMLELNQYSNGFFNNKKIVNNFLKITNSTTLNINFVSQKNHNNLGIIYNIYF